jgi:hypothetical protein
MWQNVTELNEREKKSKGRTLTTNQMWEEEKKLGREKDNCEL